MKHINEKEKHETLETFFKLIALLFALTSVVSAIKCDPQEAIWAALFAIFYLLLSVLEKLNN